MHKICVNLYRRGHKIEIPFLTKWDFFFLKTQVLIQKMALSLSLKKIDIRYGTENTSGKKRKTF